MLDIMGHSNGYVWKNILLNYKLQNPRAGVLHKSYFPTLLGKLIDRPQPSDRKCCQDAFRATGIIPWLKVVPGKSIAAKYFDSPTEENKINVVMQVNENSTENDQGNEQILKK